MQRDQIINDAGPIGPRQRGHSAPVCPLIRPACLSLSLRMPCAPQPPQLPESGRPARPDQALPGLFPLAPTRPASLCGTLADSTSAPRREYNGTQGLTGSPDKWSRRTSTCGNRTCKVQRLDRPVKKGNEFQRYWRLYEFCRASNGPDSDLLTRHWHVSSIWYS
jgi:hypothetical protein